jgi:hypothetical protein
VSVNRLLVLRLNGFRGPKAKDAVLSSLQVTTLLLTAAGAGIAFGFPYLVPGWEGGDEAAETAPAGRRLLLAGTGALSVPVGLSASGRRLLHGGAEEAEHEALMQYHSVLGIAVTALVGGTMEGGRAG